MKSKEKIKVSIDKIFPYKNNNKLHTPEQIDQIRKSIADFNLVQDIVIDEKNEIVIGHGRFEAIKQLIELGSFPKEFEVLQLKGYTDKEIKKLRVIDNKTNEMTGFNLENLKIELDELGDFELNELFLDMEGLKGADEFGDDFALPSGDKGVIETATFTLHKDQNETVKQAIEISKKMGDFGNTGNENSNGNAIARICEIFITQNQ